MTYCRAARDRSIDWFDVPPWIRRAPIWICYKHSSNACLSLLGWDLTISLLWVPMHGSSSDSPMTPITWRLRLWWKIRLAVKIMESSAPDNTRHRYISYINAHIHYRLTNWTAYDNDFFTNPLGSNTWFIFGASLKRRGSRRWGKFEGRTNFVEVSRYIPLYACTFWVA